MKLELPLYLSAPSNWQELAKNKHILFDSDPISEMQKYGQIGVSVMKELNMVNSVCAYIQPVRTEILNSKNVSDREAVLSFLSRYKFELIDIPTADPARFFSAVDDLQSLLHNKHCNPSVPDLYQAAALAGYSSDEVMLFTGDLSGFPSTYFERKICLVLQRESSSKPMYFLQFNKIQFEGDRKQI